MTSAVHSNPNKDEQMDLSAFNSYIAFFREHLAEFRTHFSGENVSDSNSNLTLWTEIEKDAFFHAVAIHSRLRPDLIAAAIKTKSLVDVIAYLDLLDDGCEQLGESMGRDEMPVALTSSEEWVLMEEEHSRTLIATEPIWEKRGRKRKRKQDLDSQREILEERYEYDQDEEDEEHFIDRQREAQGAYSAYKKARKEEWAVHDSLACLDYKHLVAIGAIMRDAQTAEMLTKITAEANTATNDEIPIDPASTEQTSTTAAPSQVVSLDPSRMSPKSRRRYKKMLHQRRSRGSTNMDPTPMKRGRKPTAQKLALQEAQELANSETASHVSEQTADQSQTQGQEEEHQVDSSSTKETLKDSLLSQGVDAEFILKVETGLGLFNLSYLGRLIKTYRRDCTDANEGEDIQIETETIAYLNGIVHEFVADVVHRSVVLRRENARRHERKTDGAISIKDVHRALDMMGVVLRRKTEVLEEYAQATKAAMSDSAEEPEEANSGEEQLPKYKHSEDENETHRRTRVHDEHHDVYTPFVRLPSSYESLIEREMAESEDTKRWDWLDFEGFTFANIPESLRIQKNPQENDTGSEDDEPDEEELDLEIELEKEGLLDEQDAAMEAKFEEEMANLFG